MIFNDTVQFFKNDRTYEWKSKREKFKISTVSRYLKLNVLLIYLSDRNKKKTCPNLFHEIVSGIIIRLTIIIHIPIILTYL
jgi:hypothetical protein